jgi:hypothetical protein
MKAPSLRSVFSSLLIGHFATALAGCSDTPKIPLKEERDRQAKKPTKSPISSAGFTPFSCYEMLPGTAAALGFDSIERWDFDSEFDEKTSTQRAIVDLTPGPVEADGKPCGGAPSPEACLVLLEKKRAEPLTELLSRPDVGPSPTHFERLILTRGAEVLSVVTREGVIAFVGPLDAPEKLNFWWRYGGEDINCEYLRPAEAGFEIIGIASYGACPMYSQRLRIQLSTTGAVTVLEAEQPEEGGCAGRRPSGLQTQTPSSPGALARYLERQAYLEGASVEAFERFATELEALGAPPALVAEALRARADETRHHALIIALGRRFDPDFACQAPEAAPAAPRSLYAFALENAVEGCVRETWGALLAEHQAARAADDAVRFTSALIADDETRHAELAWATHRWLLDQLDATERRALESAMQKAVDELFDELASGGGLAPHERAQLGLPAPASARALFGQLRQAIWAEPLAA